MRSGVKHVYKVMILIVFCAVFKARDEAERKAKAAIESMSSGCRASGQC